MKKWHETREVYKRIDAVLRQRQSAALATVVHIKGSAYRRPGAKMLIEADGRSTGNVSAGCLEADIREVALQVMQNGQPRLRSYCSSSDEIEAWDLGLGCDGQIDVYIEPVTEQHSVADTLFDGPAFALCSVLPALAHGALNKTQGTHRFIVTCKDRDGVQYELTDTLGSPQADATMLQQAGNAISTNEAQLLEIGGLQIFIDPLQPPPRLVIFGAGHDSHPIAALAATAGFKTTVVDWRSSLLYGGQFAANITALNLDADDLTSGMERHLRLNSADFVLLMTHNFARDAAYLQFIASRQPRYIGVLGPRQRTERLLQTLAEAGQHIDDASLHAPVGLDIGAEGAEAIAVAVVGEMLAAYTGRRPTPLRERSGPINSRKP